MGPRLDDRNNKRETGDRHGTAILFVQILRNRQAAACAKGNDCKTTAVDIHKVHKAELDAARSLIAASHLVSIRILLR